MPVLVGASSLGVPGSGPRLVATPLPGATPPSVRVELAGMPAGRVSLSRLNADGTTSRVRQEAVTPGGAGFVTDAEVPFGQPVSYFDPVTGAASGTVVVDADVPWLVNPFRPGLSVAVSGASKRDPEFDAASFQSRQYGSTRVLVQPFGPRPPIVVTSGGRRQVESEMTVRTWTAAQAERLLSLVSPDEVLLLNVPPQARLGLPTAYISVGEVTESRRPTRGEDPTRNWVLPYAQVQEPFGVASPAWSLDSFEETFASIDDIPVAYATLEDAELNVRRDFSAPAV